MSGHFFISYSSVDGADFSLKLADELLAGPPAIPVWFDKRHLRPAEDWDEQIVEAIRSCKGLIFVMTNDSVTDRSVCKQEWTRALRYKKPIIPLLATPDAEMPFRLEPRQGLNFTSAYDSALAKLRNHLTWMDAPEGQLQALKHRLADAERDLPRAQPDQQPRIQEDIADLTKQIVQQQAIIANPQAARQRVQQSIDRGLEGVRNPVEPASSVSRTKFINPPPLVAPSWFQDRQVETQLIGDFLKDDALRIVTILGRSGIGKSAIACRLLRALETGQLPDDGGQLPVNGIVYLSDARSFHRVNLPDLYAGLAKLLPDDIRRKLEGIYKDPQAAARQKMEALLAAFPQGRTVVLLDNFEDEVAVETAGIKNTELNEALRAVLEFPPHGVKAIITTRVAPRDLALVEPSRQRRLDLDNGLEHPYAEEVLRAMDADGKVGLRNASVSLLTRARERTRGYPRALEHLFGILSADRDTSLQEILDNTEQLLPENVLAVLVGEAFSRLDLIAQRVIQALAIYRDPMPTGAINYLLQPHVPVVDAGPVLSRLVNMHFVSRDSDRYYLHQIDRDYAVSRIPVGEPGHRGAKVPLFTRFALQHRAAEWFRLVRKPRETWRGLADLAPQLLEFELRCAGHDYNRAARVLLEIDFNYLILWGHYHLSAKLHEQLLGKVENLGLAQLSASALGAGYARLGKHQRAIECHEQTLAAARQRRDLRSEGTCLANLGGSHAELGQVSQALNYYESALDISRRIGNRRGEAVVLGNLGSLYANIGQLTIAIEYHQQALNINRELRVEKNESSDLCCLGLAYASLGQIADALECLSSAATISRNIGYRFIEAAADACMGQAYEDKGDHGKAALRSKQALEIADEIANPQYQQLARLGFAKAKLYDGDLAAAREMTNAARRFNFPLGNHRASAILAVVALRCGDRGEAHEAFSTALSQAGELVNKSPKLYDAFDTKGLALCGMALCENSSQVPAASEAYRAARALTSASGIVTRVLRLFDALAQADDAAILAEVRPYAAGELN